MGSIIFIYLLVSIYFTKHFFFHTTINGVDVSLKPYGEADKIISNYIDTFEMELIERNGETESISGRDIDLHLNSKNRIVDIYHSQNSFYWIGALFHEHKYHVPDLYHINSDKLITEIEQLNCIKGIITEPQNVKFKYSNGTYKPVKEEYGNKIILDNFYEAVKRCFITGNAMLDLDKQACYENPKYTLNSAKTRKTEKLLNLYVSTNITYQFGEQSEVIDGNIIKHWLRVDKDLEVIINETAIRNFVKVLSNKYNTVGTTRNFKTATGMTVEVKGGIYGWRINQQAEIKALEENIKRGDKLEKEPIYLQKALGWGEDEIGDTYIEINITKQSLWFYKNGKLAAKGAVVTGNPNKGNATPPGVYFINYKQKDATLEGPGYQAGVTYWMPFFGNMGLHDASWRSSFGGEIYKRRGTHGCVNAPFYLAKQIYENVEVGTPVICYEEGAVAR